MVFLGAMVALAPSAHAGKDGRRRWVSVRAHLHSKKATPSTQTDSSWTSPAASSKDRAFLRAWIGELTGNYKDGHALRPTAALVALKYQQVKPFIDIQIGGITEGGDGGDSSSAFLFVIGGGAKFPLSGQKFNILLKLDYMRAFYGDDKGGGQNIFRLGIGASLPLPIK